MAHGCTSDPADWTADGVVIFLEPPMSPEPYDWTSDSIIKTKKPLFPPTPPPPPPKQQIPFFATPLYPTNFTKSQPWHLCLTPPSASLPTDFVYES